VAAPGGPQIPNRSATAESKVTPKANRSSSRAILFAIDNLPEASERVFINYVGRDRVLQCEFQGSSSFLRFFGGHHGYEDRSLEQELTEETEDNLTRTPFRRYGVTTVRWSWLLDILF
jgi:hypothetical protein